MLSKVFLARGDLIPDKKEHSHCMYFLSFTEVAQIRELGTKYV